VKSPSERVRCSGQPDSGLQAPRRSVIPGWWRKLVVASASYTSDGMHQVAVEMFPSITPELFAGSPIEEAYLRNAPNPDDSRSAPTMILL
jgi:hypothetical protein